MPRAGRPRASAFHHVERAAQRRGASISRGARRISACQRRRGARAPGSRRSRSRGAGWSGCPARLAGRRRRHAAVRPRRLAQRFLRCRAARTGTPPRSPGTATPPPRASRTTRPSACRRGDGSRAPELQVEVGRGGQADRAGQQHAVDAEVAGEAEEVRRPPALAGVPTTWPCTGTRVSTRRGTTSSLASQRSSAAGSSGRRSTALAPACSTCVLGRLGSSPRPRQQDQHRHLAGGGRVRDAADRSPAGSGRPGAGPAPPGRRRPGGDVLEQRPGRWRAPRTTCRSRWSSGASSGRLRASSPATRRGRHGRRVTGTRRCGVYVASAAATGA